ILSLRRPPPPTTIDHRTPATSDSVFTKSNPETCPQSNSSLVNFTTQFVMVQKQIRGFFSIINDCSFKVSQFDMLSSSGDNVHWWGAYGYDYENLTSGFVISDHSLNSSSYKNESFVVDLRKNVTWDQVKVVSVWDTEMAADFGHVMLLDLGDGGSGNSSVNVSGVVDKLPTMFENCKVLLDTYRLRWTLNEKDIVIDIGLEGAIGIQNYMAFGWTEPNREHDHMLNADVAATGFDEDDTMNNVSNPNDLVNNTKLVYGHRTDGVSFIRYQRPLKSVDKKYDWDIDVNSERVCIWALGTDCCYFRSEFAFPNRPNPLKVLYINEKESLVLRVERGVPVQFSIQAGHDVAFYITLDPLGGNATLRNVTGKVYTSGPDA
nr:hypothetical protein [Tanacetum cinerariifolium]